MRYKAGLKAPQGLVLGLFLSLAACASAPPAPLVPAWIKQPPEARDGYVYAVGYSGATYDPGQSKDQAANAARVELAKSFSVHVEEQSQTVTVQDTSGSRSENNVSTSKDDLDVVVKNAEIVQCWTDDNGVMGMKGASYCLARVRRP